MAKSACEILNCAYIHQLVLRLKVGELRTVLEAIKQSNTGVKKCLRNRILSLLTNPTPATKDLKEIIIQVFTSRSQEQAQPPAQSLFQRYVRSAQTLSYNQNYTPPIPNEIEPFVEIPYSSIEFESLPFFKEVDTLLKPALINCEPSVSFSGLFYISDTVKNSIVKSQNIATKEYKIQIILRFIQVGLQENDTERLPYSIKVSVNGRKCKIPMLNIPNSSGIVPYRSNIPINITQQTNLKNYVKNTLTITWSNDPYKYVVGVFVVEKLILNDLIDKLKKKPLRASDLTKEFIKKSMESDNDIDVDCIVSTIEDPFTKLRMELPARNKDCMHMQCFDAIQFLKVNEKKEKWVCPICKKKIKYKNIEVDEFFLNILQSPNLTEACTNVILFKDGTWTEKKNKDFLNSSRTNQCQSTNNKKVVIIDDNDVQSINDLHNDTDEDAPKSKRLKCNSSNIEQSEHISETKNLIKTIVGNSTKSDISDLSLKNKSKPSTSGCSEGDIDTPSSINPRYFPNNYSLPNVTVSRVNAKEKHKEKDSSKPVLFVITLD